MKNFTFRYKNNTINVSHTKLTHFEFVLAKGFVSLTNIADTLKYWSSDMVRVQILVPTRIQNIIEELL